nr:XdhC family protein [Bordetella pertussis]
MNALDLDVLQHARDWLASGRRVHLVTVVQTWGSAPRQAGAMLAVRRSWARCRAAASKTT